MEALPLCNNKLGFSGNNSNSFCTKYYFGGMVYTLMYLLCKFLKYSALNTVLNPFSGTIRENILFGLEYDPDRYDKILEDCALGDDLLTMNEGDSSYIGKGGASLSGGQIQRVNLGIKFI